MTAEAKLRLLAAADATLQSFFGTNPFRWFHLQLPPKFVMQPTGSTCLRIQQIGSEFIYYQDSVSTLVKVRFQATILDPNADVVDNATQALIDFLQTVDLASSAQFDSPPTPAPQLPGCFLISVRPGLEVQLKPPIPTQIIDFRLWNVGLN